MPDETTVDETIETPPETEGPSLLDRAKDAIGLGDGSETDLDPAEPGIDPVDGPETDPDPAEPEPERVLSHTEAARKRYKDCAGQNHVDKEARKDAADKIE